MFYNTVIKNIYVCHVLVINLKLKDMKTMKTLILVVSAVAFAAIASAVERPKMNVIPLEADRATIALWNNNPTYFEISISAEDGSTVYYNETKSKLNSYNKVYDFSELKDGDYQVSVKVNNTKVKRNLKIDRGNIIVGDSKTSYDPYLLVNDNVLKISYLNFDGENIAFKIYNDGELVYRSKIGNQFNINAGYDLSKLQAGNYDLVLEGNNELISVPYTK